MSPRIASREFPDPLNDEEAQLKINAGEKP